MDLRIFVEPQFGATYADQLAMAQAAERLGFDAFFRSDHFMAFGGDGLPGPTDSWITLAAIGRETSAIRLGTLVNSATFRPPGLTAIEVAQADEMSGGRVELGLGAGWFQGEHDAYGFEFPAGFPERFDRLEEQLEIISGLWGTPIGETFSFTGEHYTVTDSPALPKPVQTPLPIIVGGHGPRRTPALMARFAQEANVPWLRPADTAAQFDRVHAACEAIGRDPGTLIHSGAVNVVCAPDEATARAKGEALGLPPVLAENAAHGTPEQVVETLLAYREIGVTRMYLQLVDMKDIEHAELIAAEVLPHVRDA